MTSDVITLVQELGFPIAISIGLAFALYSVVRFILKEKVEDTLNRFITFNTMKRHWHYILPIIFIRLM